VQVAPTARLVPQFLLDIENCPPFTDMPVIVSAAVPVFDRVNVVGGALVVPLVTVPKLYEVGDSVAIG
jgi:hypothetical protein